MSFHPRITKNEDKSPAGKDSWGFGSMKGNSISESSANAIKNYKPAAGMAMQYQSAGAAKDLVEDGSGYYYMPDGRLVGQYGKGQKVYVLKAGVNFDDAKKMIDAGNASPVPAAYSKSISEFNATPTLLTFAELNARAFMTVVRIGEASSKKKISDKPLDYNITYGTETFDSYEKHPRKSATQSGITSTAAGAYQFMPGTWDMVNSIEKQKDFSPESQDRAFLLRVEIVNDDALVGVANKACIGVLDDLYNGNIEAVASKLSGIWKPLPSDDIQSKMTVEEAKGLFIKAVENELAGKSAIATPQGKLNMSKIYRPELD